MKWKKGELSVMQEQFLKRHWRICTIPPTITLSFCLFWILFYLCASHHDQFCLFLSHSLYCKFGIFFLNSITVGVWFLLQNREVQWNVSLSLYSGKCEMDGGWRGEYQALVLQPFTADSWGPFSLVFFTFRSMPCHFSSGDFYSFVLFFARDVKWATIWRANPFKSKNYMVRLAIFLVRLNWID